MKAKTNTTGKTLSVTFERKGSFKQPNKAKPHVMMSFRVSLPVRQQLEAIRDETGRSMTEIMEEATSQYVERYANSRPEALFSQARSEDAQPDL